ncbi:hypothetical protein ED733_001072 [Metarhizium rileyi]|nr:hypothetical protein ED733_001072 [Metarhizium rileyi]
MESFRADLLRRAQSHRTRDRVQQRVAVAPVNRAGHSETGEPSTSRSRPTVGSLSSFSRPFSRRATNAGEGPPKSPHLSLRPPTLASSRHGESGNQPGSLPSPIPMAPMEHARQPSRPDPVAYPTRPRDTRTNSGSGDNPPERSTIVAVSAESERPARNNGCQNSREPLLNKAIFCFPRVRSRRVRSQILTCFVSGVFLATLLAVYLGLALTNRIARGEVTIMIILIILSATMFFCYSVIRLCVLVSRGDRARRRRLPEMMGPGGYVVPPKPIPVVLARDEEAAGIESETAQSRPPAYGLWRESVRVDPNRLFWQRNEAAEPVPQRPETRASPRPPSYASDDGISYVVEARPRSMAPPAQSYTVPASDVPLVQRV